LDIKIPLPPIELQEKFASIVKEVEKLKVHYLNYVKDSESYETFVPKSNKKHLKKLLQIPNTK